MKKIFIDTSCYLAIFIKSEVKHREVVSKLNSYIKSRCQFYTSYYVLNELYTRILYDFGGQALKKVLTQINKSIESGEIKVVDVDEVQFNKSSEIMVKFAEHKLSLVDASIYNLVKDLKLDEIFTLDSDFKKVGLRVSF